MNVDIHSHFFPIEALRGARKYQDRAPEILLENRKCSVISGGGQRGDLSEIIEFKPRIGNSLQVPRRLP